METNKEEWRAVSGYEDIYEVSNLGNVRSLDRYVRSKHDGCVAFIKGKSLTAIKNKGGYLRVNLCDSNGRKAKFIHRLVCLAFIPNPDNLPEINHKDENTFNNCVDNLEWCTSKYNSNYGHHRERVSESNKGKKRNYTKESYESMVAPKRVAVIGTNLKTGEEIHIRSIKEVKYYGFSSHCVSQCVNHHQDSHKGYKWRKENGDS